MEKNNKDSKKIIDRAFDIGLVQNRNEVEMFWDWAIHQPPMTFHNFLEIGSNHGGFSYLLSQLAEPGGNQMAVDLPNASFSSGGVDVVRRKSAVPGVIFFDGSSFDTEIEKKVCAQLSGGKLDFLFIDGDHRFPDVDHHIYGSLVRSGGWIMFHDIVWSPHGRQMHGSVPLYWMRLPGFKIEIRCGEPMWGLGLLRAF